MRNEAPGGMRVAPTAPMTSRSSASPWERLQTVLLSLTPNETITVDRVVEETGLSPETVGRLGRHLGELRVDPADPVTVLVHLACPRLAFADRGKGVLVLGNGEREEP